MNWTDEEIDKLFQESSSQMNVPYQDAFWKEMEAMLPADNKRKGLGWIFGGTVVSVILVGLMIISDQQTENGTNLIAKTVITDALQYESVSDQNFQNNLTTPSPGLAVDLEENSSAETAIVSIKNFKTAHSLQTTSKKFSSGHSSLVNDDQTVSRMEIVADQGVAQLNAENLSTAETINSDDDMESQALALLSFKSDFPELAKMSMHNLLARPKNHNYYMQVGIGLGQSYISGTDKSSMTSINLGAGYQYRPEGFGFSAGINLNSTFANNLEITRRSKIYGFSVTNFQQNLQYKQLYALELPISVDFRKERHTFSIGLAPTYLMTTVMRFTQYEEETLSSRATMVGQKSGLNTFGLKTGIGYQVEIAKNWNVGVQLQTQLFQQLDAKEFVGEQSKFPLSGQITIRKKLTR